jgi:dipeptidyl aminopeptidase/acylaminoacyl peptidase
LALWFVVLLASGSFVIAAVLAEGAIHPLRLRRAGDVAMLARGLAQSSGASVSTVSITAKDGVRLHAWWLVPKGGANRAVIVCHGLPIRLREVWDFQACF